MPRRRCRIVVVEEMDDPVASAPAAAPAAASAAAPAAVASAPAPAPAAAPLLMLRGPTGVTKQLADGLTLGRGEMGLSNSMRISRKHLQIMRTFEICGQSSSGGSWGWEVWRKGANAVQLFRSGTQRDIDKMSGVAIRAGDSLVLRR